MSAILTMDGVRASYGNTRVLHGLSLEVREGGISALLGANGAGKTTAIRAICGAVDRSGQILLGGTDIARERTESIARLGVAHVQENRGTFGNLSVYENLKIGAYGRKDKRSRVEADIERFYDYFPRLKERRHQQAGTLSGGEQQMLALSRALMSKPRLLLLDEPSFGLAPKIVSEIFQILRKINGEERVSMLLVEQNANMALHLSEYGYVIEAGRIALEGSSSDLMLDQSVRRSYLGY
jgi:branched-chain amino acid transport system ATP-binding protein